MAQTYYTPFVLDASKAGTPDSSNFPVLILVTDARFKSVANGGHVAGALGYDIRPYSDSALTTALTYELVPATFDPTTGFFEMWVLQSTLSHTSGATIYIGYGDAALNTDGSGTGTWNPSYKGVWHLPNGTTLTMLDSTSNANNGTNHGTAAAAGQIDGCGVFLASSSRYIDCGTGSSLNITTLPLSAEWWFKRRTSSATGGQFGKDNSGNGYGCWIGGSNTLTFLKAGVVQADFSGVVPADTNWHHWVIVCDSTSMRAYLDGALVGTNVNTSNIGSSADIFKIGRDDAVGTYADGSMDEFRISAASLSTSWITSAYNNQSAPTTFAVKGTEVAVGGGATAWGPQLSDQLNRIIPGP